MVVNFHAYGSKEKLNEVFPPDGEYAGWLYVGRSNRPHGLSGSPLANRYVPVGKKKREEVIEVVDPIGSYRAWLYGQIRSGNEDVLKLLRQIGPKTALVCWCSPRPCHADVIEQEAARLRETNQEA